jgi:hypothetical protein
MGLPSRFLPAPNPRVLLKSIDIDIGGLHPSLEGRGEVAASLGSGGT